MPSLVVLVLAIKQLVELAAVQACLGGLCALLAPIRAGLPAKAFRMNC
jgi:hypothetical protein